MAMAAVASRGVALRSRVPTFALKHSPERRWASDMTKAKILVTYSNLITLVKGLDQKAYQQNPVFLAQHLGKSLFSTAFQVAKIFCLSPFVAPCVESATGADIPNFHQDVYSKWQSNVDANEYDINQLNSRYAENLDHNLKNLQGAVNSLDNLAQQDPDFGAKILVSDYKDTVANLNNTRVASADDIGSNLYRFKGDGINSGNTGVPDQAPRLATFNEAGEPESFVLPASLYDQARNLLNSDTSLTAEQKTELQNFVAAYQKFRPAAAENGLLESSTRLGFNARFYHDQEFIKQYKPLLETKSTLEDQQPYVEAGLAASRLVRLGAAAEDLSTLVAYQQKAGHLRLTQATQPGQRQSFLYPSVSPELSIFGKVLRFKDKYFGSLGSLAYIKDCFSVTKAIRSNHEAIGDHAGRIWCYILKNNELREGLANALLPENSVQIRNKTPVQIFANSFLQDTTLSLRLRSEHAKRFVDDQNVDLGEFASVSTNSNHVHDAPGSSMPTMTKQDILALLLDGGRYASARKLALNLGTQETQGLNASCWQRSKAMFHAGGNVLLCAFRFVTLPLLPVSVIFYWAKHKVSFIESSIMVCRAAWGGVKHSAQKAITLKDFARHGLAPNPAAAAVAA